MLHAHEPPPRRFAIAKISPISPPIRARGALVIRSAPDRAAHLAGRRALVAASDNGSRGCRRCRAVSSRPGRDSTRSEAASGGRLAGSDAKVPVATCRERQTRSAETACAAKVSGEW